MDNNCPDCHINGGMGRRCLKHYDEYEQMQIEVLQARRRRRNLARIRNRTEQEIDFERKTGCQM